jgi:hypothetical protein
MSKGMFDCGHPRGPSKDYHNAAKDTHLNPGKSSVKGHNPAPAKHHSSPAKEYPHGHAGAKKK